MCHYQQDLKHPYMPSTTQTQNVKLTLIFFVIYLHHVIKRRYDIPLVSHSSQRVELILPFA